MGERCNWSGPLSEMVVVEWMPEHLRASHTAARNSGSYPHNGAMRIAVEKSCADLLIESESEWANIVSASPEQYAEEVE